MQSICFIWSFYDEPLCLLTFLFLFSGIYERDYPGSVRTAAVEIFQVRPRWAAFSQFELAHTGTATNSAAVSVSTSKVREGRAVFTPARANGVAADDQSLEQGPAATGRRTANQHTANLLSVMSKAVDSFGFAMLCWEVCCGFGEKPYAKLKSPEEVKCSYQKPVTSLSNALLG